jgi:HlyD family secretion protein
MRHARHGGIVGMVLFVLTSLLILGAMIGSYWLPKNEKVEDKPLLSAVIDGPFENTVEEQGEVESSSNLEIRCEVKSRGGGGMTIIEVIPEGSVVKEGDQLVKLDSTALEQEHIQQQIVCNTSEANVIQAKSAFESAEIAKTEYLEGTFKQEEQLILSEIFVAEQNLRTAQLAMSSAERLSARGIVTSLQLEGDQFAVEKAKNELLGAQTKLDVLRKYTRRKMLTQLESDIASAKAKWDAELKTLELEQSKKKDIEDQIAKCTIRAPHAGQVVYANKFSSSRGSSTAEFVVEPGAVVREQQPLIRLPDPNNMQVRTLINEARVNLVRPGMPATIQVGALQDQLLTGEVLKVNQYAEPGGWSSGNVKKYAALVKIQNPPETLRTGSTSQVRIYVERRPNALQIPVQSVARHNQKYYCIVEKNGQFDTREIENGPNNEKFVVVTKGLQSGEQVVLNPRSRPELKLPEGVAASSIPLEVKSSPATTPLAAERPQTEKGPPGKMTPASMVKSTLEQFDTNQDGSLQSAELAAMPAERSARLAEADTNKDGVIDRLELTTAMARVAQMMRERAAQATAGAGI